MSFKSWGSLFVLAGMLSLPGCGGEPQAPPKGTDISVPELDIEMGDVGVPEAAAPEAEDEPS